MTKRKPFSDALAENFVYGQTENAAPAPTVSVTETLPPVQETDSPPQKEPSLMDRLLETPEQKEATKRFTVDLPESMHRKLSILAARSGRKKADIVRVLLDDLLKDLDE